MTVASSVDVPSGPPDLTTDFTRMAARRQRTAATPLPSLPVARIVRRARNTLTSAPSSAPLPSPRLDHALAGARRRGRRGRADVGSHRGVASGDGRPPRAEARRV